MLLRCEKCGASLEPQGELYICPGCGAKYTRQDVRSFADEMARLLDEQKQEAVANLRQQLWRLTQEDYLETEEISRLAKGIMAYLPDDFFAAFCALACGGKASKLNKFLISADVKAQSAYIWDVMRIMLHLLNADNLLAVNDFLARAQSVEENTQTFARYNRLLAQEAEKVSKGVYNTSLPRDAFIAYKSEDMEFVNELVEEMEGQGLKCFVAARNLQHGAVGNYDAELRRAMDHCRTVVFVSSTRSRSMGCDALTVELPYIRAKDVEGAPAQYRNYYDKLPEQYKKPRVEFVTEPYRGGADAAEEIVGEFFAGYERCYDAAAVIKQVMRYKLAVPAPRDVKYCLSCGAENAKKAKFCSECGGREFAATREEYEQAQRARAEQDAREAEAVRRAEEERKKAEDDSRRAAEAQKKAEEEAAALRAELEKLKAAQKAASVPVHASVAAAESKKLAFAPASAEQQKEPFDLYLEGVRCCKNGEGAKAAQLLQRAAEQGVSDAAFELGIMYEEGDAVPRDYGKALAWYKKADGLGELQASNAIGNMYFYGRGVNKNYKEAIKWYRKGVELDDEEACFNLANCYEFGNGVEIDLKEAALLYEHAAELGYWDAERNIATCYYFGKGVEQNYAEAVKWYKKAAEHGDAVAQFNLGVCYLKGQGVLKNLTEAIRLFRLAAAAGDENAKDALRQLGQPLTVPHR